MEILGFDPSILLGPQGGSHAVAFIMGGISSYFAINKILIKPQKERVDRLEDKLWGLINRVE